MQKRPILKAEERKILGSKIKKLRREGIIPAHVYGAKIKSESIQVGASDFEKIYQKAGETGLVDLTLDSKTHTVLIAGMAHHPVSDQLLHIDFRQVSLTEKVKVEVPIVTVGEAPAVEQNLGVLLQPLSHVEVEALPEDLPEHLEVDISGLSQVEQEIKVGDLKVDSRVTVLANPEEVIVKVGSLITEEMKKTLEEEAAVAEAAKVEAVTEAGAEVPTEAPTEAPAAAEEKPTEEEQKKEE